MNDLTPPAWSGAFLRAAVDEYWKALSTALRYGCPYVFEEVPADPAWLAGRVDFAERWKALVAEGLERGYLDQDSCYECAGALELTTNTTTTVRHPNPDYQRIEGPLTIPRAGS